MSELPVFYASTEGQTRRIAERIASILREQGLASQAIDLAELGARPVDWKGVRGVVLGASLHRGRHQPVAERFLKRHREAFNARASALFSVSLSTRSRHPREVLAARALAQKLAESAGWQPQRLECFAGRLAYTQYGFVKRLVMRFIAKYEGGSTDTSRDHEYTDWESVRRFALDIATDVGIHDTRVPAMSVA